MKTLYKMIIHYTNGSTDYLPFEHYHQVRDFYQHKVSYTGDRVKRVEVSDHYGSIRAIWDISWDTISQRAGLTN